MKWMPLFAMALLVQVAGRSQYTVRVMVSEVATRKLDPVYVAGTFNDWNPQDEKYRLKAFGTNRRGIVLSNMPAGKLAFKFTRGNNKWETNAKGEDIANHEISVDGDTLLTFNISGWKDDFPDKPKPNTASTQVIVVDTAFNMLQLGRKRRIWAYLPKGYKTSKKRYPVLYMHDGQNLFNEQTAPFGEWGVDEALDSLLQKGGREVIVIGIDNDPVKRMNEYSPYDTKEVGKAEGDAYVDFLALTLKPYIDTKFRTMPDVAHTYIAGSSMGGLISLYAVMKYPLVYGGAGIFSPSVWAAPGLAANVAATDFKNVFHRMFFYCGGAESKTMVRDMDDVIAEIEKKKQYETQRLVYPLGKHNEAAWRKAFPEFYAFIVR